MDCIVHGVTKSLTQLSDFHFTSSSNLECFKIIMLDQCLAFSLNPFWRLLLFSCEAAQQVYEKLMFRVFGLILLELPWWSSG